MSCKKGSISVIENSDFFEDSDILSSFDDLVPFIFDYGISDSSLITINFSEADDKLYNPINGQKVDYHWQNYAFSFKKKLLNNNGNSFVISIVPTLEYWRHASGSKDSKSIYNQKDSLNGKDRFDNFIGSLSLPISKKLN